MGRRKDHIVRIRAVAITRLMQWNMTHIMAEVQSSFRMRKDDEKWYTALLRRA